ncbi:MAG: hypothetical protein KGO05_02910 [Chloroflexota bacterium]|nr:hypothetical protein [Chloroflexota bacterium]
MKRPAGDGVNASARRLRSRLREARMGLSRPAWLRWPGARADVADPSAAMFQRIRRSMTLLYAAVLAVTLLLAGSVLYVAVQQTVRQTILDPAQPLTQVLQDFLDLSTQFVDRDFAQVGGARGCSEFRDQFGREFVGMTFNHSNQC